MTVSFEQLIKQDIQDGIVNGAAIYSGTTSQDLYQKSFGYADCAHKYPMTQDTITDLASVTKVAATITALLKLHSQGKIDFDAPFTDYLPAFQPKLEHTIRIRDLANHTSGFGDVPGQTQRLYFDEDGQKMLRNVLATPPPFPPTERPQYACWNYILLAMIVEQITGQTFSDYCRQEIYLPLGMKNTSLGKPLPGIPEAQLAQTMGMPKAGQISDFVAFRIYRDGGCTGNAGLFSNAHDLSKLLRCYLRHGVIQGEQRLFTENEFAEIAPDSAHHYDDYRRFGWVIYDPPLSEDLFGTSLFHSGWSGQTLFMNFAQDRFVIVLTPRCGDYDRAKATRFEIIRQLTRA